MITAYSLLTLCAQYTDTAAVAALSPPFLIDYSIHIRFYRRSEKSEAVEMLSEASEECELRVAS